MSTCRHRKEKLMLLVYDELTESERAEVEEHLKVCSVCQQECASLQKLKADSPSFSVGDDFLQPTRRALFYTLRSHAAKPRRESSVWRGVGKLALQAGLAAALIFFGFKLGQQSGAPATPTFAMQDLLTAARTISVNDGTISPHLAGFEKITINPDGTVEIAYSTINNVRLQGEGDDPAVQQMLQYALLVDDDPIVRQRAVKTVQQLAETKVELDPLYFEAFTRILDEEENLGVKLAIIDILGHVTEQPQARDMLFSLMLKDDNEAVRIHAFQALMRDKHHITDLDAVLSAATSDSNTYIRTKSLEFLKQNKGTSL